MERFTSVVFRNFKAFKHYSLALTNFNVLVGPNNAGKSTVIAAFRMLSEAMRRARARAPEHLRGPEGDRLGYRVNLSEVPVASENIFSDYDDSHAASVTFRISNGNRLVLYFPERDSCMLFTQTEERAVRSPSTFKSEFNCDVAFVPVLGPVEHNEPLYQKEAARQALITHRASRNFRNIWHHYPEQFPEFRDLLRRTWPRMDIEAPRLDATADRPRLHMFCLERRIPRELFWAGFGFQVWCQMLTFIVEGRRASLLAIDEPDIYLHSDLQRQLLSILKDAGPDILIATHSPELVSASDPHDIVVIDNRAKSARRLNEPSQLQPVFKSLGSNLNPTLTQLAKTRRALFVEGRDFDVISWFAERLGKNGVATRGHFAVLPAHGFNPQKVADVSAGIEATLGTRITRAAIFDRDYRSDNEVRAITEGLKAHCTLVHVHSRKEIENFALVPTVLERAIRARLEDRRRRTGATKQWTHDIVAVLGDISESERREVQSQCLTSYVRHERASRRGVDDATLTTEALAMFEDRWSSLQSRLAMVPGKEVFAQLNGFLMREYGISLSLGAVARTFRPNEIPQEMVDLVNRVEEFGEVGGLDG